MKAAQDAADSWDWDDEEVVNFDAESERIETCRDFISMEYLDSKGEYQPVPEEVEDIPESIQLSEKQQFTVDAAKYAEDNRIEVDKSAIQSFLHSLTYPLYHFDFETYQQAIPEFNGVRPFQQIPFQYSLHIEHKDKPLEPKEFLGNQGSDPREPLVKQLVSDIPLGATVLAFNASFEQSVLRGLAEQFPKYKDHLQNISNNIVDLAMPFQKKYYYQPEMKGKFSIKIVLPLLVPEMEKAYDNLDLIHNGGEAMQAFAVLAEKSNQDEIDRIRESLKRYCELDTLAMVKILDKLKRLVPYN